MANISKIKVENNYYDIKDSNARSRLDIIEQSGSGTWGNIIGTLSDQTDLQNALTTLQSSISTLQTSVSTMQPTLDKALIYADSISLTSQPQYISSTTDLIDGSSYLAPGCLYFYYEVN